MEENGTEPEAEQVPEEKTHSVIFRGGIVYDGHAEKNVIQLKLKPKLYEEGKKKGQPIGPVILNNMTVLIAASHFPKDFNPLADPYTGAGQGMEHDTVSGAAHLVNSPIVTTDEARWTGHPGTPGSQVVIPKTTAPHLVPHRMQPGAFQINQWLTIKIQADQDIFDQFDLPDVMRGKVPEGQTNMSGRLGLALQDLAGMMSKPFLRSLEAALVKLAKVDIALMLKNWKRHMWERLIEKDEMENWLPEEERLKKEAEAEEGQEQEPDEEIKKEIAEKWQHALDLIDPDEDMGDENIGGVIDIDIKLTAGSSMPTNRMAKMEIAIELYSAGIWDRRAVLEYVDDPNKELIIARMDKQDALQAQQELLGKARK